MKGLAGGSEIAGSVRAALRKPCQLWPLSRRRGPLCSVLWLPLFLLLWFREAGITAAAAGDPDPPAKEGSKERVLGQACISSAMLIDVFFKELPIAAWASYLPNQCWGFASTPVSLLLLL